MLEVSSQAWCDSESQRPWRAREGLAACTLKTAYLSFGKEETSVRQGERDARNMHSEGLVPTMQPCPGIQEEEMPWLCQLPASSTFPPVINQMCLHHSC